MRWRAIYAAVVVAACGGIADREILPPEGQLIVFVDTDAWLPRAPGELAASDDYTPLFHKLRIELFAPGASEPCEGCTREFSVDRGQMSRREASVGFVPRAGVTGYRARVRLYRAAGAGESLSEARADSTIESIVSLPAVSSEGIREVSVVLRTENVGRVQGSLDAPIEVLAGRPESSLVGGWQSDVRRDCNGQPREGEVCIAGGAFWMGAPSYAVPIPERLVALSPFFVDATEVTVGAFRASNLAEPARADPDPIPHNRAPSCTYTASAGEDEERVLNCVTPGLAAKYCEARGGSLPSEAQYEFVASAFRSLPFPWGTDLPTCEDAVFARSADPDADLPFRKCASLGTRAEVPGRGARDRVRIGNVDVVDLAANVAEWMRDGYRTASEGCWDNAARDPECPIEGAKALVVVRGGDWSGLGGHSLASNTRSNVPERATGLKQVGFRCVRRD